jgi:hypothetical protein
MMEIETDPHEIKRLRRLREPLAYCKWISARPGLWFGKKWGKIAR